MPKDRIHYEEQHISTVSSIKLILFFKKYFSSYKATMCATIILACFAIGSDLILPQLLKIALDSHITVSAQKLSYNNSSALPKVLLNEQSNLLIPTSNKNTFFIINEDLKTLP